jgi:hypothetical protein
MTINRPCNNPPAASAGMDFHAECSSALGATVTLDGSESTDVDSQPGANDDIALFEWFEDFGTPQQQALGSSEVLVVNLPLGPHRITLRVGDRAGATGEDEVQVTVVDTTAPVVTVAADPAVLWPPNHRMVAVTLIPTAHDACDPAAAALLASVTSSEPDAAPGEGGGHTSDDIQDITPGAPDSEVLLRAERSGLEAGRLYTITFTAVDSSGNAAAGQTGVLVPHDQGGTVEPIVVDVMRPNGASPVQVSLEWTAARDAISYNILRGSLSRLTAVGSFTVVEDASCVARDHPGTSFSGGLAQEDPDAGEAFFYLVESFDGRYSGYGTATGRGEVVITSGDACH